ncbi:MAG: type II CAAX endopeptidase family protein [Bdellovibrionota bacterium]
MEPSRTRFRHFLFLLLCALLLASTIKSTYVSQQSVLRTESTFGATDSLEDRTFELQAKFFLGGRKQFEQGGNNAAQLREHTIQFLEGSRRDLQLLSPHSATRRLTQLYVLAHYLSLPDEEKKLGDTLRERASTPPEVQHVLSLIQNPNSFEASGPTKEELGRYLGWFSGFLPGNDPTRALAESEKLAHTALVVFGACLIGGVIGIAAFVAFVRKVRTVFHRSQRVLPESETLFETFCLYLLAMTGLPWAMHKLNHSGFAVDQLVMNLILLPCLLVILFWAKRRNESLNGLLVDIGYIPLSLFRLLREACVGLFSYFAMLVPAVALMGVFAIVLNLLHLDPRSGTHPIVPALIQAEQSWRMPVIILLAVCVAPIVEETMFRGVLYGWLRTKFGVSLSVLLSALVFASVHPQGVIGLFPLTLIGIALALVREWRGNLLAGMVVHACVNGMTLFLVTALLG